MNAERFDMRFLVDSDDLINRFGARRVFKPEQQHAINGAAGRLVDNDYRVVNSLVSDLSGVPVLASQIDPGSSFRHFNFGRETGIIAKVL